ncbi:MAG: succinate dehydrogenase iron-sulfur subunit [Candidatus Zixiibacteriota bacterium]|nr:MAG: succinate dehydrogenase iron-sulfur subunit [candidate division Zixibacteria bacterium]
MPIFKVFRYNPRDGGEAAAIFQEYEIPDLPGMTVLEGLYHILENQDPTLAFRSSCRQGICGSCAMHINGQYRLACETQIAIMGDTVTVRPLAHMRIIRDLVVDLDPFFAQYEAIKPYLIPAAEAGAREYRQSPGERARIDHHVDCILCAACYGSCPVVGTNENYIGPHALLKALRFVNDSRDGATGERLAYIATENGVFRCHTIFNCQQVCPKDLDPTGAIGDLKMKSLWAKFTGKLRRTG